MVYKKQPSKKKTTSSKSEKSFWVNFKTKSGKNVKFKVDPKTKRGPKKKYGSK